MMRGLFARLFSPGERSAPPPHRDSAILVDFLKVSAEPRALDPLFTSLLARELRWERAPKGLLERLPLSAAQREQYDFAAICNVDGRTFYLLDSRPTWAPDIPYVPSFLVAAADPAFETLAPIGTFDAKPAKWTFAWKTGEGPLR